MTDLIDIKKQSHDEMEVSGDEKHYPWGTSLRFEDDLVDQLDLGGLAAGDVVEVRAVAFVESKSEHKSEHAEGGNHSEKSISLQLTKVKVSRESPDKADTLYGES